MAKNMIWIVVAVVIGLAIILAFRLSSGQPSGTTAPAATVPLSLSKLQLNYVTETGATVSWSTNQPSTGWVEYGTDSGYGSSTTKDIQNSFSHVFSLNGLKSGTVYHLRACSSDASGHAGYSADIAFSTLNAVKGSDMSNSGEAKQIYNPNLENALVIAWHTDGKKVAYIKYHGERADHRQDIFTSNRDGSNEQQLTHREQEEYTALAWSPDTKKIAYVGTGAQHAYMQLWVMDAEGSNLKWLTGGPSIDSIGGPLVWSTDGRWIAFGYSRYGSGPVYDKYNGNNLMDDPYPSNPDYSKNYDRRIIDIDGNNEAPMPQNFPAYHAQNN